MKVHLKTSPPGLKFEQKQKAYQDILDVMDRVISEAKAQELPSLKEYRRSERWLLEQLDKKL